MDEREGNGPGRQRRRVRASLPRERVTSRADVVGVVLKHRELFREQAVIQLGEGSPVDEEVDAFVARKRAMKDDPQRDDALPWLMQQFREQLYRARKRLEPADEAPPPVPRDPVLGDLDDKVLAAFEGLSPAEREAMDLAVTRRLSPAAIAKQLHLSARAVGMRLYRARQQLREQFPDRFGCVLGWLAWGRSLVPRLGRRVRRPLGLDGAAVPTLNSLSQLVASLVVVVGLTGQVSTASASEGPAATAVLPPATTGAAARDPQAPAHAQPAVEKPRDRPDAAAAARSAKPAPRDAPLLAGHTATTEPPEDAQIEDLAVAPSYASSHALVAVGAGRTCGCPVLYQSTDGGHTWAGTAAPWGARQVVLPPDYPADQRIFLGAPADGTAPDYVMYGFGGTTVPLPAPPGYLALAAGFGKGDDRVLIAGRSAVSSVDVADGRTALVLGYPGASNPALLATAPALSAVVAVVPTSPTEAAPAEPIGSAPGIYLCATPKLGCVSHSSATAGWSAVDGGPLLDTDPTLIGIVQNHPVLSQDGGRTFTAVPLVTGATAVVQASVADGRVWGTFASAGVAARRLAWLSDDMSGTWHDMTSADAELARVAAVVAVNRNIVIALLINGAMRCSVDGGQTWAGRCPTP